MIYIIEKNMLSYYIIIYYNILFENVEINILFENVQIKLSSIHRQ